MRDAKYLKERTWNPPPVVSEVLPDHGVAQISPLFRARCSLRYELIEGPEFEFRYAMDVYDSISNSHHVEASRCPV